MRSRRSIARMAGSLVIEAELEPSGEVPQARDRMIEDLARE
jgi:hypothetical protein